MPDTRPRFVIPPYILRRIVDHGSAQQQRCAQQTLSHVQTLMAHVPGRPAAAHVAMPSQLERDIYDARPMIISASPMIFSGRAIIVIRWTTAD